MSYLKLVPKNEHFIRDIFVDFLLSREAMLCSPATLDFYRYTAGKFIEWLISDSISEPSEIRSSHVRTYIASLRERNLADNTLHAHARTIKTFLCFCYQEKYVQEQIQINMPQVAQIVMPMLDVITFKKTLNACKCLKHKALLLILLDTGLRREEAANLNWGDIDIASGLVRLRKGKGGKARSVVIGVKTRRVILKYRRGVPNDISDSVFNLTGNGIRAALRRIGERIGIRLTAHMFRRTFATMSLRNGMSAIHLQGLLGHSSLEMVRRYIPMLDEDLLEAHREHGPVDNILE